jgi:hypothetical protein
MFAREMLCSEREIISGVAILVIPYLMEEIYSPVSVQNRSDKKNAWNDLSRRES